jgi:P27 family predicted phage terminase small subunit
MPAGRKPKPPALRRIEGNPGKRPIPKTPQPPAKMPTPPPGLCAIARAEWKRAASILHPVGLLTVADRAAFEGYCLQYANRRRAMALINSKGLMIGKVKNPAAQLFRDADSAVRAWCAEFGMTPSARGRMALPGSEDEDELERLLHR